MRHSHALGTRKKWNTYIFVLKIKASFKIWNHQSHGDMLMLRMKSTGAFPYFQNPIWSKHIGKLEIRQSKYNKRLFSVALRNNLCKSFLVLVWFPTHQTNNELLSWLLPWAAKGHNLKRTMTVKSNWYFALKYFEMQFYCDQLEFFTKRPEKNISEESSDW